MQLGIDNDSAFCKYCGYKISTPPKKQGVKKRGNGQGSVYRLPNGKWRAVATLGYKILDGAAKPMQKTKSDFRTKKDALEYLPQLKNDIEIKKKISLSELYDIFVGTKKYERLSKSQRDKLGYAWKRLSDVSFFDIKSITLENMQSTIDSKVSTYYPARDMKVMLNHLFDLAIRHGYIERNPVEYIELPESEKSKKDAWKPEEIESFWADWRSGNVFTGYILIMIYVGLRYGELPILKDNIHLDEKYMVGGIKTDAGIDRTIPIADSIIPIVKFFFESNKRKLLEMNQDNFYSQYWSTIKRLGVRELNPHCCRHTYFTRLASAGVQPGIITAAGGHTSYQTTLGYTHLPLDDLLTAVNMI